MRKDDFVDIEQMIPSIKIQMIYATPDNFVKKVVYPIAKCFLRRGTALKLLKVQEQLQAKNLGLLIYDGYRPLSIQKIFWELTPSKDYVADPSIGSKHNRGAAVDVTLITKVGKELEMPTKIDDFTEKAHRSFNQLPLKVRANRQLLEEVMLSCGFEPLAHEWWHFNDNEWMDYPIEDICLTELAKKI